MEGVSAVATRLVNVCDLKDGVEGEDVTTVSFGLERDDYEIELCAKHAAQLRERIGPFVDHARRVSARRTAKRPASARRQSAEVRRWARDNGHPVSERGRIPGDVLAKYDAAH